MRRLAPPHNTIPAMVITAKLLVLRGQGKRFGGVGRGFGCWWGVQRAGLGILDVLRGHDRHVLQVHRAMHRAAAALLAVAARAATADAQQSAMEDARTAWGIIATGAAPA